MWTRVMRESPNLWLLLTFPAAHWLWCRCGGPIWHHGDQGNLLGMTELQERNLGPQSYQASPSSFTPRNKILERNKILSSPCYHYFGFVLELINLYSLYSNWSSIFFAIELEQEQISFECLLCARHCLRVWGYRENLQYDGAYILLNYLNHIWFSSSDYLSSFPTHPPHLVTSITIYHAQGIMRERQQRRVKSGKDMKFITTWTIFKS